MKQLTKEEIKIYEKYQKEPTEFGKELAEDVTIYFRKYLANYLDFIHRKHKGENVEKYLKFGKKRIMEIAEELINVYEEIQLRIEPHKNMEI